MCSGSGTTSKSPELVPLPRLPLGKPSSSTMIACVPAVGGNSLGGFCSPGPPVIVMVRTALSVSQTPSLSPSTYVKVSCAVTPGMSAGALKL